MSDADSSVSRLFFFKKLNRLFFLLATEGEPSLVLVLERVDAGGVLPFGLAACGNGPSATPKTCNASCHNSRSFSSWSGVRFPGLPGGIEVVIGEVGTSRGLGRGSEVDVVDSLKARENPAAKPMDAPIATAIAMAVVQLMLLW